MANIINSVIYGGGDTPSGWYPPSDWPSDWQSEITNSDNGFVMLVAVYPDIHNYMAFTPAMTLAGGTIDWGDGNTGSVGASGVKCEHEFTYSGITTPVTSMGYKVAVVVVKFTGNVTSVNIGSNHSSIGTSFYVCNKYLAMKLRTQASYVQLNTQGNHYHTTIQYYDLADTVLYTAYYNSPFNNAYSLQKVDFDSFRSPQSTYGFQFANARNIKYDDYDISGITGLYAFFYGCRADEQSYEADISAGTDLSQMFRDTYGFTTIKLINTGSATNINYLIYNARGCVYCEMDDCSSVTSTTGFVNITANQGNISGLILSGLTVGINISNQYMDATALDAFFTALGTASGSQTITVTGNPGAATCDTSIATGKGFTVTT